jgi:AGZA family xanthine/uracil permease-like MFS transporter
MTKLLNSVFDLEENNTNVKTEVIAGLTTFMTMAYIIAVNPSIVSTIEGIEAQPMIIATALSAAFATLCMAFLSNYPFALAPGMGLNAYFTYTIVLGMGLSWETALGAVFISGFIFLILTLTNVRKMIINAMPMTLKSAVSAGIGMFIAFIGMQNAGLVVNSDATLVTIGKMTDPSALLAIVGLIITGLLMAKEYKGSILIGIIVTTLAGIPLGVTEIPASIIQIPTFSDWAPVFMKADIIGAWNEGILTIVFVFLFVDLFDTTGTLVGVSQQAGLLDENGDLPRADKALLADSVGTMAGSMMGTPTVTTYVESASGVAQGGRTGLTGVVVSICFILSIFFTPLIQIIPAAATAPALIIVGSLMLKNIVKIPWDDIAEALPAFVTIIAMPFTYSIATGISLGFILYPIVKFFHGEGDDVHWMIYILGALFIAKYIFLGS